MGVECSFMAENPLMGRSSGSAFLAFFAVMDRLGLIISCVPVFTGEMEVMSELGIGVFNLTVTTTVLMSRDVESSLPVRLIFLGFRKMCAPLRAPLHAASVTLAFGRNIWHKPRIY